MKGERSAIAYTFAFKVIFIEPICDCVSVVACCVGISVFASTTDAATELKCLLCYYFECIEQRQCYYVFVHYDQSTKYIFHFKFILWHRLCLHCDVHSCVCAFENFKINNRNRKRTAAAAAAVCCGCGLRTFACGWVLFSALCIVQVARAPNEMRRRILSVSWCARATTAYNTKYWYIQHLKIVVSPHSMNASHGEWHVTNNVGICFAATTTNA